MASVSLDRMLCRNRVRKLIDVPMQVLRRNVVKRPVVSALEGGPETFYPVGVALASLTYSETECFTVSCSNGIPADTRL